MGFCHDKHGEVWLTRLRLDGWKAGAARGAVAERALERGMTPMKTASAREPRGVKEGRTVKVETRCTPREREMIIARAASVEMRLSDYLRTAALHSEVRSKADKHAVRALAGYTGELGRLGGLLKLWLSARRGEGVPAIEVDRVLAQIAATITRMDEEMERL